MKNRAENDNDELPGTPMRVLAYGLMQQAGLTPDQIKKFERGEITSEQLAKIAVASKKR